MREHDIYYNEIELYAVEWIRNLQATGLLGRGTVDERPVQEVRPDDIAKYRRAHFFAGIGGWELALQLAGWPEHWPVWTGSCPCQPFSQAGKRKGVEDERHLWPFWHRLIKGYIQEYGQEHGLPVLFGEQVDSPDGRIWLAGVRSDLETLGYEVGAADLCAAGVNSPQIRQRLWWVAYPQCNVHSYSRMGDTLKPGLEGLTWDERNGYKSRRLEAHEDGPAPQTGSWDNFRWVYCLDGKARRIEPGIAPLAYGIPSRVGQIRAYGNAIVPQLAAEFIMAAMEVIEERLGKQK